ncbi:polysaccharide deacetylase family protein [Modestobacter sp. URMC 112]
MSGGPGRLVPVLLYHAITDDPGRHVAPFAVPPATFAQHMDQVVAAGYRCVTFTELMRRRSAAPARAAQATDLGRIAVITFDDGYADFATAALPTLHARALPATLFVTTGWLVGGGPRCPGPGDPMLAWSQLPELLEGGVEIGAHSHSHPQLDTLGSAELRDELNRPKELLEGRLGRPVPSVAYPHGYNGPRVRRLAREAGHESGAAVRNRLHRPADDPFDVARLTVGRTTTPEELASWLAGVDRPGSVLPRALARAGWRAYRRGRAVTRRRPGSDYA